MVQDDRGSALVNFMDVLITQQFRGLQERDLRARGSAAAGLPPNQTSDPSPLPIGPTQEDTATGA